MRPTAAILPALAALLPAAQEAPAPPAKSLLLITLDTTRADALGCGGGPEWATPRLDALAAAGVRFAAARAPAPVTLPAHCSILTGLFPFQHGVRDNGTFVLPAAAVTLAERLKAAGYATAAVPAAWVVDSSFGLNQGFDRYFDLAQSGFDAGGTEAERPAGEVVALATAWLAAQPPDRPFFLWAHFFDAHFPYRPPADLLAAHPFVPDPRRTGPGPRRRDETNHLYELEVAAVDRAVATLLGALDRFGGVGRVLVVVAGDHGEALGEHGEATHSALLHDATLRVPLIFAGPGVPPGRVVDDAVTTVDVTPTVLALLGIAGDGMAGADLTPLLAGRPLASKRPLYAETCASWFTYGWRPRYALIDGNFKVEFGRTVRVFDLVGDPRERHDVAAGHEEVVERARERLRELAERTVAATRRDVDEDARRALDKLGYLGDSGSSRRGGLVPPGWQPKEALSPEEGLKNQRRYSQANQLWQSGKREEAIEQLLELTREEPENSNYASLAANLLLQLGRAADAVPLARRAVELADSAPARSTLVAALLDSGARDAALAECVAALRLHPALLPMKLTLGELLLAAGRAAEAVAPLEEYLAAGAKAGADGGATLPPAALEKAQNLLQQARAARAAAGGK